MRQRRVSLCETLDRVLNKGAVIAGDVIISVAGVDLLYVGLSLVVTSVESMREWAGAVRETPAKAGGAADCPPAGGRAGRGGAAGSGPGRAGGAEAPAGHGLVAGLGV